LPSYDFLAAYRAKGLLSQVREIMRPDIFARLENAAAERGMSGRDKGDALCVISKIVLHTGTGVDALTPGDVPEMFAWSVHADPPRRQVPGLHAAWDLLGAIGVTPAGTTLRSAQRRGQRTTAELVGDYSISCRPVRDVLVRYLDERRPALDYKTLASLAGELAGTFWADIERHHPGIDTLHLPRRDRPGMEGTRAGRHGRRWHDTGAQEHTRSPDAGPRLLPRHPAVGAGRPELGAVGGAQPGAQGRYPGI